MLKHHHASSNAPGDPGRPYRAVRRDVADLVPYGFEPVRSRWTWQPRLTELWLRSSRHNLANRRGTRVGIRT